LRIRFDGRRGHSLQWEVTHAERRGAKKKDAPGRHTTATGSALEPGTCIPQDLVTMNVLNSVPVDGARDVPPIAVVAVMLVNGTEIEPPL
jgi:hypothetical protein